ncbi:MAG TPA: hypothetical protein VKP69_23950, partial [Isosphaeraceae bacterium]|nr:hypothetical protein [Isosphaeraceae bacterium]
KLTMKKAYGFRTVQAVELALYHTQPWEATRAGIDPQILLTRQKVPGARQLVRDQRGIAQNK